MALTSFVTGTRKTPIKCTKTVPLPFIPSFPFSTFIIPTFDHESPSTHLLAVNRLRIQSQKHKDMLKGRLEAVMRTHLCVFLTNDGNKCNFFTEQTTIIYLLFHGVISGFSFILSHYLPMVPPNFPGQFPSKASKLAWCYFLRFIGLAQTKK